MTKTAFALRHLAFEDLGVLEPVLRDNDYDVRYLDVGVDPLTDRELLAADLVVVLGGPIGANDGDRYPVIDQTIELLHTRLENDLPTLGICLGAQLIARALGASVGPGTATEIGYSPLTLRPAGQQSPLRHLEALPVLHWHNDRFEIPAGAVRLAATATCDNQAFAHGRNVLALQFHLEVPQRDIERWLIGHAEALAAAAIDPNMIRGQAAAHGPAIEKAAVRVLTDWLGHTTKADERNGPTRHRSVPGSPHIPIQ